MPAQSHWFRGNQFTSASRSTTLPGAAENVCLPAIFAQSRHPLDQGIDRGGEDARTRQCGARAGQAGKYDDAARRNRGVGRYPVIGLAIPGGEIEELDVRRGESQRLTEGAGALAIARDMDERDSPAFRVFRNSVGNIRDAKSIEAVGDGGERERAALDEFGGHVFEISHDTRSIRKLLRSAVRPPERKRNLCMDWTGMAMEGSDLSQNRSIVRGLALSSFKSKPAENVAVLGFQQTFIIVEFHALHRDLPISASAKRPRTRSISRVPRCQERNSIRRCRASRLKSGACRLAISRSNAQDSRRVSFPKLPPETLHSWRAI